MQAIKSIAGEWYLVGNKTMQLTRVSYNGCWFKGAGLLQFCFVPVSNIHEVKSI